MFFNHNTGGYSWNRDPNYKGPIGRWDNLKVEDNELRADAVLDVEDDLGKVLNNKIENNFIRAASIGFRVIETSNDPSLMDKGQTYPTITKCELMEISICDLPSNKNALALFDVDGNRINLEDTQSLSFALSASIPQATTPTKIPNMKLKIVAAWTFLAAFFNVEAGKDHEIEATPEQLAALNAKVETLSAMETEIQTLKDAAAAKTTELSTAQSALATAQDEIKALTAGTPPIVPVKTEAELAADRQSEKVNFSDPAIDYNARANKALGI